MPTLNLNNADKLYYGNIEAQKLYKGSLQLFPNDPSNGDPHWNNVVLLLKGDGTNDSTNIVDSSSSPKTITRVGEPKISTAQSKYGGSSIVFDGSGDYLDLGTIASTPDYAIFNKDYTIETWLYSLSTAQQSIIGNLNDVSGAGSWWLMINGSFAGLHQIQFFARMGMEYRINESINFPVNQWVHLAICKAGVSAKIFLNGILQGVLNLSGLVEGEINTPFLAGISFHTANGFTSYPFNGYIDSLRLTKNVARYTANFNPETDTYLAY